MPRIFRIHPAVGVARVGNANRDDHFVGPELPGTPANFDSENSSFGPFKVDGLVRPQAAQFRVWEYERMENGVLRPLREALPGRDGIESIEWSVHVANRKAEFYKFQGQRGAADGFATSDRRNPHVASTERESHLVIDPGRCSIRGSNAPPVILTNRNPLCNSDIPDLGELRTDAAGRLRVIGGSGRTAQRGEPPANYVNNDGWYDDVGDGPVHAVVSVSTQAGVEPVEADPAWVVVGPPDFAPSIGNVVSLYDTMWDVAVRALPDLPRLAAFEDGGPLARLRKQREEWQRAGQLTSYRPSFADEIWPLLRNAFNATAVHMPEPAVAFHATLDDNMIDDLISDEKIRSEVFSRLRDPDGVDANTKLMPKGLGDEHVDESETDAGDPRRRNPRRFFSLTRYQYAIMKQWRDGSFEPTRLAQRATPDVTPEGLDRAALENCVGGPFYPGIEVSWLVRNAAISSEPFRIKLGARIGTITVGPGFLTQQMAIPWQADFRDCKREVVTDPLSGEVTSAMWWAAQRPDDVFTEDDPETQVPWVREPHFRAGDEEDERYLEMIASWFKQGFVSKQVDGVWVETERNP